MKETVQMKFGLSAQFVDDESEMRYPTDQKLLWECNEKAYSIMCTVCQRLGIHRPRTKYLDVEKGNLTYVKQRKHNKSQQRKITRRLIKLRGRYCRKSERFVANMSWKKH